MGDDSRGTRKPRTAREDERKEAVMDVVSEDRPTSPIAGSTERAAEFETARRDSAKEADPEEESRDAHRRPTVRRRVFK
jgi:hypothetical protein